MTVFCSLVFSHSALSFISCFIHTPCPNCCSNSLLVCLYLISKFCIQGSSSNPSGSSTISKSSATWFREVQVWHRITSLVDNTNLDSEMVSQAAHWTGHKAPDSRSYSYNSKTGIGVGEATGHEGGGRWVGTPCFDFPGSQF